MSVIITIIIRITITITIYRQVIFPPDTQINGNSSPSEMCKFQQNCICDLNATTIIKIIFVFIIFLNWHFHHQPDVALTLKISAGSPVFLQDVDEFQ